ncbi:hypothetical protein HETIRDRAFT_312837 [Heterobasidion irregulare TC 32-1]|uniref:Uncharacterized protein n=1 Tax=Heterobasidion irregulare (strain TC 32-1) TaxID=747525 RepID=W4KGM9_HETIT|nr:uncharacterized protein HETIRDRAFT_312837 [Heterobasidion irregulare TC 32-1]ETW84859.1 hypothetical protein HETIRDRAFT_312837 [Heterobasidion irregulare TC 32-1]
MVERSKVEQSLKSNLKRKAVEVEHRKSNSLASMDAQRMVRSHQPQIPSGLIPGFTTKKASPFKIPALPKSVCAGNSRPRAQQVVSTAMDIDEVDSNTSTLGTDYYGGLEDEDESIEGAAVLPIMAKQRNRESLNREKDHHLENRDIRISPGHGHTQASQMHNVNRNAEMPADLRNDEDSIEEFKILPHHTPAGVKVHYHLPDTDQSPQLSQPHNHPKAGRSIGFTTDDLPAGTQARWRRVFVPSWRDFVGTFENPWDVSSMISQLQQLWDTVFPHVPHTVAPTEAVYCLAMQRIYEWRNGFTIAALQAVKSFWNGDPAYRDLNDNRSRQEDPFPMELCR